MAVSLGRALTLERLRRTRARTRASNRSTGANTSDCRCEIPVIKSSSLATHLHPKEIVPIGAHSFVNTGRHPGSSLSQAGLH
jgi:hypothetical protein